MILNAVSTWTTWGRGVASERKGKFERCMIHWSVLVFLVYSALRYISYCFSWKFEQKLAYMHLTVEKQRANNESLKKIKVRPSYSSTLFKV
jgi:hypothetical protein